MIAEGANVAGQAKLHGASGRYLSSEARSGAASWLVSLVRSPVVLFRRLQYRQEGTTCCHV
jgi:hypothetical protein